MTASNNSATIEGAYSAFARTDVPALASVFASDVVWHYFDDPAALDEFWA